MDGAKFEFETAFRVWPSEMSRNSLRARRSCSIFSLPFGWRWRQNVTLSLIGCRSGGYGAEGCSISNMSLWWLNTNFFPGRTGDPRRNEWQPLTMSLSHPVVNISFSPGSLGDPRRNALQPVTRPLSHPAGNDSPPLKVNDTVMRGDGKRTTDLLLHQPFHFPSLGSFYF